EGDLVGALPEDARWHVEKDPGSAASVTPDAGTVRFDYRLRAGERRSQFVALVTDVEGIPAATTSLHFAARSGKPMRVWVQFRANAGGGVRWTRSVFVDSSARDVRLPLAALVPVDRQPGGGVDPGSVGSLLFVVDLTNAVPGDAGALELSRIRFVR